MRERGIRRLLPLAMLLVSALVIGCGDVTSATGDQGKLRFSLGTDFEVPESNLRDATIVARHTQRINVDFTGRGRKQIEDPLAIRYEISSGTATPVGGSESSPPSLNVNVVDSGEVRLRALVDGEEIDGITLQFEQPDSLELSVRVREPWGDDLDTVATGVPTTVQEGSQITFVPIPLGVDGSRLAGEISTESSVDDRSAVVPGQSLIGVYEDGVWRVNGNIEFYLIDPTDGVTFTVTDTVTGAIGQHTFIVEDFTGP